MRCVTAFSVESLLDNTIVLPPPRINVFHCKTNCSLFRKHYLRGDIPCGKLFANNQTKITTYLKWKVPFSELDIFYHLPLFFEGLSENLSTYHELAIHGIFDLLHFGNPDQIVSCIPQLILPMRRALNTKNICCIISTMKALHKLVMIGENIGPALVPYFRQILPIFNLFRSKNICIGDHIDYNGQIGDFIDQTLQILEYYGGPDAYINIKYVIPTYESCIMN
ncbi:parkin coregulated gene protein-like [Culicoides brevitarsis]|uniref:parkin coregulated gene protein-like n=1 Tax=Culicoides brevitarsis TaxID=469753 RepID=UPI00307B4DFD